MADGVAITPGTGTTIATDEVGGLHYQRVKLTFGVDGAASDVSGANPLPVSGTFFPTTQPVSLAALPALPTGGNVIGAVTQSGAWSVTGSGNFAITAAALPLPTGAATETTLAALNTKVPAQGQAAMAASLPVAIASNQSALAVSGTFWQATQPVSLASLPALVAGAALIGKVGIDQTTPGTTNAVSLSQISSNSILTGNGVTGTGSQRVTIASDNTAFSVNAVQSGAWSLTANQSVNVAQMNGVAVTMGSGVVGTGVQRVVLATDVALPTGSNTIGALTANQSVNNAQIAGVATATGNGVTGTGSQRVTVASDNTPFPVKIDQTTPGTTNAVNSTPVTPTPFTLNSAATTNATSVKGSAGTLYGLACSNAGAAAAFVKLYNKATAPTVGTDVPVITIPIPASSVVSLNLGTLGHRFATGIALATTNLVADSDTTAVAANQVKVMADYV